MTFQPRALPDDVRFEALLPLLFCWSSTCNMDCHSVRIVHDYNCAPLSSENFDSGKTSCTVACN
jgi:hypothetical protein